MNTIYAKIRSQSKLGKCQKLGHGHKIGEDKNLGKGHTQVNCQNQVKVTRTYGQGKNLG